MAEEISVREAGALLRSREDLLGRGVTERGIRAAVAHGALIRVRRGWYVAAEAAQRLWPEGRHLLHVLAVHRDAVTECPVFSGVSAAVLLGLPLYRTRTPRVHTVTTRGSSRSMPDVLRHEASLTEGDVIEVDGLRCTGMERTVLDLAATLSPEAAVACADAALRSVAVSGQEQDAEIAAEWRDRLGGRAVRSHARGIRQARRTIAFADGRAQLPGESVSRLQLDRLGFRDIGLQTPVSMPDGTQYWVDFDLAEVPAFGEFDGLGKYLDETMRGAASARDVVLAEKRREDDIRGRTGRRIVRWGAEHIRTPEALGARLAAFGIRPRTR